MSELRVADTTVPGVLESLRKCEWKVPHFQREFVWSTDQVSGLVQSILEARPIGMVTLWEQADHSQMPLDRVSIQDHDAATKKSKLMYFGSDLKAAKTFALLDGRQRCTAIAMAFGGFRAAHGKYKYSGRYFLDVCQQDSRKRVRYLRESDIKKDGLDVDSNCVAKGLFPLASNQPEETVLAQWMRYLQALTKPDNYPNGQLPEAGELSKRNGVLQDAFEGIVTTKMAVYYVPEKYELAEICDIFETLNTTGTLVSTVDLIHSWLYADTFSEAKPLLLRDWIAELGQRDGAIGWATLDDRPELVAQMVTACYVSLEQKPKPRPISTKHENIEITSVKSSDLLATPVEHWKSVVADEETFATYMGDAQRCVAGGFFPWTACPYPVSIAVYLAHRWHWKFDSPEKHPWTRDDLDALFKAFFWRNALTRRYDQGFLSQLGADLEEIKKILRTRPTFESGAAWAQSAEAALGKVAGGVPTKLELIDWLTDGNQGGALQKALLLPMIAGEKTDLVNNSVKLSFPSANPVELHHIYPREWCRNNKVGDLALWLDEDKAGRDYVNSVANLMPLSRESNNRWKQKNPAQFLSELKIKFMNNEQNLRPLFIDEAAFEYLASGANGVKSFWDRRAELIANDLLNRTRVII
jgi:hypothetical protein